MLGKAAFLVFMLMPLFLASEVAIPEDEAGDQLSSSTETESSTTATSSDTGSGTSADTTSTSSGTPYVIWTNVLVLTTAILLK